MLVILGLALLSAFNPKLLIVDLLLVANKRPLRMFACFLLGGIGLGLAFGLLDLLVLHIGATKTQIHVSGGLDLVLGIPLLAVGALLATDHVHIRRRRHHPSPKDKPKDKQPSKLSVWAQQALQLMPFAGLADLPFRLYSGHIPADQVWSVLAHQLTWTALLVGAGRWLLARGTRRLVVQGG